MDRLKWIELTSPIIFVLKQPALYQGNNTKTHSSNRSSEFQQTYPATHSLLSSSRPGGKVINGTCLQRTQLESTEMKTNSRTGNTGTETPIAEKPKSGKHKVKAMYLTSSQSE